MKFRCILANIICLILICVVSVCSCLAWSSSTYTNKENSITADNFGLTLSYKTTNDGDFVSIDSNSLLEMSDGTYYIKSVPDSRASIYYALTITQEDDGSYYLGYISSSVEITTENSAVIKISNIKTQYTIITISDNSITSLTSDSDPTVITNEILIQPDSEEPSKDESDETGADGTDDGETNADPDIEEEPSEDEADGNDADGNDTGKEDTSEDGSEVNQDEVPEES